MKTGHDGRQEVVTYRAAKRPLMKNQTVLKIQGVLTMKAFLINSKEK